MELLYIWIKDFLNIKNCGINFCNTDSYNYNQETKTLNRENSPDYNFFIEEKFQSSDNSANIMNVTALIGENGAGKTNIFRFILQHFPQGQNSFKPLAIIVYKEDGKIFLYNHNNLEISEKNFSANQIDSLKNFQFTRFIYYSGIYQATLYDEDPIYSQFAATSNISTNYLLKNDIEDYFPDEKSLKGMSKFEINFNMEMIRQIYLLKNDE